MGCGTPSVSEDELWLMETLPSVAYVDRSLDLVPFPIIDYRIL